MSTELMAKVWHLKLRPAHQAVLLCMADHAWDDGTHCFPSVGRMSYKTGYSERHVQRILRELEAQGLIVAVQFATGGRGRATAYTICLEKGDKKSPFIPKGDTRSPFAEERVTSAPERVTPMSPQPSGNNILPPLPSEGPPQGVGTTPPDQKNSGDQNTIKKPNPIGTRLPSNWKLADELRNQAIAIGLTAAEVDVEAEKFCDYWTAATGQRGRKTDWAATWRMWVRRAVEDRGRPPKVLGKPQGVGSAATAATDQHKHPFFAAIIKTVSAATFNSWFQPCRARSRPDGVLELTAPTKFHRDWITGHFTQEISFAAAAIGLPQVAIVVQNKGRAAA